MKSFFEFLGFVSTALISGFLVFSYVGHKKNADRPASDELVTAYNTKEKGALPEMTPVSSSRRAASKDKKTSTAGAVAGYQAGRNTVLTEASASDRLKDLYNDDSYVRSVASKWKKQVANASETYSVKPGLLLSNIVVKSYLGSYGAADFKRDVSEHAGDLALPTSAASKSYDYAWSVAKLAQQYDLAQYFPAATPVAAAKVTPSYKAPAAAKKTTLAAPEKAKPAAALSPVESGFREMVAKEEGFSSWQGLQRLGDLDAKKRADKRVKMLLGAARVR